MGFFSSLTAWVCKLLCESSVQVMELLVEYPLKRLASSVPEFGEYIPVLAETGQTPMRFLAATGNNQGFVSSSSSSEKNDHYPRRAKHEAARAAVFTATGTLVSGFQGG
jgi:hypothetical protein